MDEENDTKQNTFKRKRNAEEVSTSFIEHVNEHYFDSSIINSESIIKWIAENPEFNEVWKNRKITPIGTYIKKKNNHKDMERVYKKFMFKFMSDMTSQDPSTKLKQVICTKAESLYFFKKYLQYIHNIKNSNNNNDLQADTNHIDWESISDQVSDEVNDAAEISKLMERHYVRKKYKRMQNQITKRAETDTNMMQLVPLLDDPKALVLYLLKHHHLL